VNRLVLLASVVQALLAVLASPAEAAVITISEVLYDAPGSDDGQTFVELYGAPGLGLAGFVLEGVNGANGAVTHRLDLSPFAIPDDGFFVLADGRSTGGTLVPEADALFANLDLQNGPDSVRLVRDGIVVDALGYGAFGAGDFFAGEGSPAPDAPPGSSLARVYSDLDTGSNALDFVVVEVPTPGRGEVQAPVTEVPEPCTLALMGLGCAFAAGAARRHSRRQKTSPPSVVT
jgi:hypothetical protein